MPSMDECAASRNAALLIERARILPWCIWPEAARSSDASSSSRALAATDADAQSASGSMPAPPYVEGGEKNGP